MKVSRYFDLVKSSHCDTPTPVNRKREMHLRNLFDQGDQLNRNRVTAGIGLLVLLILILIGLFLLRRDVDSGRPGVNRREPVPGLAYCASDQVTPCIVSFSRDQNGKMLVNILTDSSFPDFYLKITHDDGESIYPCQQVESFSTSVYCIGKALSLGEVFHFFLLSIDDNRLLAQGNFSIIGMALSTVEIFSPSTPGILSSVITVSPTRGTPTRTPTAGTGTPTRTPTLSYPNPSTPSYP